MIFSLLGARPRRVSGISYGPRAQWPALVRNVRRIAFDDDEVRHVERRKEEACRETGTMIVCYYFPMRLHLLHVISDLRSFPGQLQATRYKRAPTRFFKRIPNYRYVNDKAVINQLIFMVIYSIFLPMIDI